MSSFTAEVYQNEYLPLGGAEVNAIVTVTSAGGAARAGPAAGAGARASWPAVMADLDSLTETEVEQDGKHFLLRSTPRPGASLALSALGVALPPTLHQVANA